jgi:hypothetical protein
MNTVRNRQNNFIYLKLYNLVYRVFF